MPCSCGSPFLALERIDGRCDDIFIGISEVDHSEIFIFQISLEEQFCLHLVTFKNLK